MNNQYYSIYISNNVAYIKDENSYVIEDINKYIKNNIKSIFEVDTSIFGINQKYEKLTTVIHCNYKDYKINITNNDYEASIFCYDEDYRDKFTSLTFLEATRILNIINNR